MVELALIFMLVHQETLLLRSFRNVALMLDADSAGVHGSAVIADRLGKHCVIEIVGLATGQQPNGLSTLEIYQALSLLRSGKRLVRHLMKLSTPRHLPVR